MMQIPRNDYLNRILVEACSLPNDVIIKSLDNKGVYWITNNGDVISLYNNEMRYLQTFDNGRGYYYVNIGRRKMYIHRLLAFAFTNNEEYKKHKRRYDVHHLDYNSKNNSLSNLCIIEKSRHRKLHDLKRKFEKWNNNL